MYGYGYGSAIDSLGVNNIPMCDFQTWYQNYYPLYAQMYGAQTYGTQVNDTTNVGAATMPNFRGNGDVAVDQNTGNGKKKGNGGKAVAVISAAALIGSSIACYRKGNGEGLKKIADGFKQYKNLISDKISKKVVSSSGIQNIDTLPEEAKLIGGTFEHEGNKFTFRNGKITRYIGKDGKNIIDKYVNPTTQGDVEYSSTINSILEQIKAGQTPTGCTFTNKTYTATVDGKNMRYLLNSDGKYRAQELSRKWFG